MDLGVADNFFKAKVGKVLGYGLESTESLLECFFANSVNTISLCESKPTNSVSLLVITKDLLDEKRVYSLS